MQTKYTTPLQDETVSAMALRRAAGELLNQVFYRNQRFVVERAGERMAVLMPFQEYLQYQRRRQRAKARVVELAQTMRKGFMSLSSEQLDTLIDEAVDEVRTQQTSRKV